MLGLRPYNNMDKDLFRMFDEMERGLFAPLRPNDGRSTFRTDIKDCGDKYLLEAEMPGFKKEEINIDLEGDILTISAEHSEEKEEKNGTYVTRERRFGRLNRSFDVSGIEKDGIAADYADGVLKLELPKTEKTVPETKKIEIR